MKNNFVIFTCKRIKFYSPADKDNFFAWVKKSKHIKEFKGEKDNILLYVKKKLTNLELLDLVSLFRRYKINTKQLEIFNNSERLLDGYKEYSSYCIYPSK